MRATQARPFFRKGVGRVLIRPIALVLMVVTPVIWVVVSCRENASDLGRAYAELKDVLLNGLED